MPDSKNSHNSLPTQAEFLENGLVPCTESSPCPVATKCSICTEDCAGSDENTTQLVACQHYFHKECLMKWFQSFQMMRGTCPNCRFALFKPDRLTDTQTGMPNARVLNFIARFMIEHAQQILEQFLATQEELIQPFEIVHGWNASILTRDSLEDYIRELRDDRAHQQLEDEGTQARFLEVAQQIENALVSARAKYEKAMGDLLRENFRSIRQSLDYLGVNLDGPNQDSILDELEKEASEMSEQLTECSIEKIDDLLSKARILATRVNSVGRKLMSQNVDQYCGSGSASTPTLAPQSNTYNLDQDDLDTLDQVELNRQLINDD